MEGERLSFEKEAVCVCEFGKSLILTHLKGKSMMKSTNAAGSSEDEELEAVDRRRAKRKMTLASKKHEKEALDSKSKKKGKVLVEVIIY